jgi:hypothetical protein
MYVMYMVRKQLYIEERQERALKRRAKALGISEADIVRKALDAALVDEGALRSGAVPSRVLGDALKRATEFARTQIGGDEPRYKRDELYDEREARWLSRS